MEETTSDKLQVAYEGPALRQGRMPMLALAAGLRGQALLAHRVSELLYGDSVTIQVDVDPSFESGSLIVPVHILSNAVNTAEQLLTGRGIAALSNLLALLGFMGISATSLYKLFKRLRGRPIEHPDNIPADLHLDISIELLIRIYNDNEVQTQLRKTIEPLHQQGIEEFQTRRRGVIVETVSKGDLQSADEAEIERLTRDEEVDLDIEKAAWRRSLAWHFSDGRTSFDAKIDDEKFWTRVEQGEPFADGDRLRVHLQTTARRTINGILKLERRIPTVLDVQHARRNVQEDLFKDQGED
ncbi:MAG: hypothetical protein WA708_03485 [Acidobacteriaceae bacterium]